MSAYSPDVWIIVEMNSTKHGRIRKILGGWYGGYLGSDSWRLSSGITRIVEHDKNYEIHNESGSVYTCWKSIERTSMLTEGMFQGWAKESNEDMSIRRVPIEELRNEFEVSGSSS